MIKRIIIAMSISGGLIGVVPAVAADIDGCGSTNVCLYSRNDFQGKFLTRGQDLPRFNFASEDRNINESWANNSNVNRACAYDGLNGSGAQDEYGVNDSDDNVAPFNEDDKESMRTRLGC